MTLAKIIGKQFIGKSLPIDCIGGLIDLTNRIDNLPIKRCIGNVLKTKVILFPWKVTNVHKSTFSSNKGT